MNSKERFNQYLFESGGSYNVTLDPKIARELVRMCRQGLKSNDDYKLVREHALEAWVPQEATGAEWLGYKDFIDRTLTQGARNANALRNRPFAPRE